MMRFPEGTTHNGLCLINFKSGAFTAAPRCSLSCCGTPAAASVLHGLPRAWQLCSSACCARCAGLGEGSDREYLPRNVLQPQTPQTVPLIPPVPPHSHIICHICCLRHLSSRNMGISCRCTTGSRSMWGNRSSPLRVQMRRPIPASHDDPWHTVVCC